VRAITAFILTAVLLTGSTALAANLAFTPTTTLAAETGNNTSAASTFAAQANGNLGAGNVSKVPTSSLLYFGAATKIYVHFMPWFGGSNHMNVGYRSDDPAQVRRQIDDMMSRGLAGAIIDWYGPNNTRPNATTFLVMSEAETRGGNFEFAVTEDVGALNACAATAGCDVTQRLIDDLNYAWTNFEGSPAYMRVNGRPVVFFFGVEKYAIDWSRARAGVNGNPLFVFRNSGAFSKAESDGGFAWVNINTSNANDIGLGYLDNFYATALKYPGEMPFGASYKGFNDTLAAWGAKRVMNQNCGQTWLASIAEAGKYYNASRQLPMFQLVTWNDYEEGSELETGVENCVTISASLSGTSLGWSITGSENTLDHYTVFVSRDGQNLMPLADVATGNASVDLSSFALAPGSYTLYVKAVGKPSIVNKMSAGVSYTVPNQPPVAALSVTPASGSAPLLVTASTAASSDVDGVIASSSIDFGDGTVLPGPIATHTYAAPGAYTVTATVTDDLGATASATASVTAINLAPIAALTVSPASGISPLVVTASTAGSSDPDGSIASSTIDFGDGAVAAGPVAAHTYAAAGVYTVKATVVDNFGSTATAVASVSVTAPNQPPFAALSVTPASGLAPLAVVASTAGSLDRDGRIAASKIDFGDGAVVGGTAVSHTYIRAGKYTVIATVTDNLGASSSATKVATASGVNVVAPLSGATVSSPVRVVATAYSVNPITTIRIYLDDLSVYTLKAASLDTLVSMSKGSHRMVVQAWDSTGTVFKTTVLLTVR
jgi:PKD repeat protein